MLAKNRYGVQWYEVDGEECCRHSVPLEDECRRCVELLNGVRSSRLGHADFANLTLERERPQLVGAGPVVCFDEDVR